MYSSGGGPGSRLVMTTSSTSPTSPLRIARLDRAVGGVEAAVEADGHGHAMLLQISRGSGRRA